MWVCVCVGVREWVSGCVSVSGCVCGCACACVSVCWKVTYQISYYSRLLDNAATLDNAMVHVVNSTKMEYFTQVDKHLSCDRLKKCFTISPYTIICCHDEPPALTCNTSCAPRASSSVSGMKYPMQYEADRILLALSRIRKISLRKFFASPVVKTLIVFCGVRGEFTPMVASD